MAEPRISSGKRKAHVLSSSSYEALYDEVKQDCDPKDRVSVNVAPNLKVLLQSMSMELSVDLKQPMTPEKTIYYMLGSVFEDVKELKRFQRFWMKNWGKFINHHQTFAKNVVKKQQKIVPKFGKLTIFNHFFSNRHRRIQGSYTCL